MRVPGLIVSSGHAMMTARAEIIAGMSHLDPRHLSGQAEKGMNAA
jgi:hypothetical protein